MRPPNTKSSEKKMVFSESASEKPPSTTQFAVECWFDDTCILDMDYFVKTLSGVKAKGIRPDLIGSIIAHYASKWLPELSGDDPEKLPEPLRESPESVTASWMKKRFFVETLVGILPPEKDSVSCNFLLRLLRKANMVGAEPSYRAELEKRVAWQLDQASLKEIMIPAFSHTCGTLLDVDLVLRLVNRFNGLDEAAKSGAALVKVAKLVDCYLAEAAVDANLTSAELMALGSALPSHARATDDGLYRAIDTYLKAHPSTSKQERKILCRLVDSRKLSSEASLHAAQNERLPVRAVIQVLFSEHSKLNRHIEWSDSIPGILSPNPALDPPVRCFSKREVIAQQTEIHKLRDDVMRLQSHCLSLQAQVERLVEKKKKKKKVSRWRKLRATLFRSGGGGWEKAKDTGVAAAEAELRCRTPMEMKKANQLVQARTPPKWRNSLS